MIPNDDGPRTDLARRFLVARGLLAGHWDVGWWEQVLAVVLVFFFFFFSVADVCKNELGVLSKNLYSKSSSLVSG